MKATAIVIQRPKRQRPAQRTVAAFLTSAAWLVWFWLWLPLVTLLAWLLGLRTGFVELAVRQRGYGWHSLTILILIAVICAVVTASWSHYNYRRFRGVNRRQSTLGVGLESMANALDVRHQTAVQLRASACTMLQFADDGVVTHRFEGAP